MKTENNILIAFLLNIFFAALECIGGILTGSVAIMSDAIHDGVDALSIGVSYFLERKSRNKPDKEHTYGYVRYSVLGGAVSSCLLLFGSVLVGINAMPKIFSPMEVREDGMILFAVLGVSINGAAALFTKQGKSINQRAVCLHMMEDALSWAAVLLGGIIIKITGFDVLDPILSVAIAAFMAFHGIRQLHKIISLFLEKVPSGISVPKIKEALMQIEGVEDVRHIHIRSLDGTEHCATMHIVSSENGVKERVRKRLLQFGIQHITIELEEEGG